MLWNIFTRIYFSPHLKVLIEKDWISFGHKFSHRFDCKMSLLQKGIILTFWIKPVTHLTDATTWREIPKRYRLSSISCWNACGSSCSSSPVPSSATRGSSSPFTATSTPASMATSLATTSGKGWSWGEIYARSCHHFLFLYSTQICGHSHH